jgi:hypothetical protein
VFRQFQGGLRISRHRLHHRETSPISTGDSLNEFDDVDNDDSVMGQENEETPSDEDIISDDNESSSNIEERNDLNHHSDHEDPCIGRNDSANRSYDYGSMK